MAKADKTDSGKVVPLKLVADNGERDSTIDKFTGRERRDNPLIANNLAIRERLHALRNKVLLAADSVAYTDTHSDCDNGPAVNSLRDVEDEIEAIIEDITPESVKADQVSFRQRLRQQYEQKLAELDDWDDEEADDDE